MHQKVCNDSTKRNGCSSIFLSESVSGILYCFPHMVEDNVNRINFLLSGKVIKNIHLIIIDEIRGTCCFPMVEAPDKDLCPESVDITQILNVFFFLDIRIESG